MVLKRAVSGGIKPVVWWFGGGLEDYQLFFFDDVCLFECGGLMAWLLLLAH